MIQLKNISKIYNGKNILNKISFNINESEIISLLGINGAGKSTLSNIIAGIKQASSGDILYQNLSIYENISTYKKNIGFCQQTPNLDGNLTLFDNLFFDGKFFGLSNNLIIERIEFISKLLDLSKYLYYYDYQLSGGFKQRFMIARSLIHSPKYLILDEPTVAMDPDIRRHLWETIKELRNNGISILLTTHYLEEAEILSDRVCILHQGEIKLENTVNNLLNKFNKDSLEEVFISFLNQYEKEKYESEMK